MATGIYDEAALKKKKAGAFLAVAQGSPKRDAGIVRLRYAPPKARGKTLCLIGKGICYDTGGTNLKPANYMFGMHEDMQGSAVALGALLALSQLDFGRPVECWLALAMNHIGPNAYKPNDVVTAADGSTIEVVHTDAEGRMILADTLALAARGKARPDHGFCHPDRGLHLCPGHGLQRRVHQQRGLAGRVDPGRRGLWRTGLALPA